MKIGKPFICKQCGKKFHNLKAVTGHKRIHSLKYRKGEFCTSFDDLEQQQEAAANAALTLMMLRDDSREIGSGQSSMDLGKNKSRKTFKCAVCFKEFGSGNALGGHMRAHYYKCSVCLEVFRSGEDLEDHKRADCCVKKGSTVYKCSICFREFGSGTALGGHTRVHKNVVTKQQGSYTLDLLQEMQAGRSFSGSSYDSPSDTSSGAQEIPLQRGSFKLCLNKNTSDSFDICEHLN